MLTTDWTDQMRAHRVVLCEEIPEGMDGYDYVDCFAITKAPGDERCPRERMESALGEMPTPLRVVVRSAWALLGLGEDLSDSESQLLGWHYSEPDRASAQMATDRPRASGRIIVREVGDVAFVTTFVLWRDPKSRLAWRAIAPVHRFTARFLMDRVAAVA